MRWLMAWPDQASATVDEAQIATFRLRGAACVGPVLWDGTEAAPLGPYLGYHGPRAARVPVPMRLIVLRESLTPDQRAQVVADGLSLGIERAGQKWGMSRDSVRRVMREADVRKRRPRKKGK